VFGDDPLSVAPASLATLAVLATVLDGEMIER